jgi:hypothetical protein
LAVSPDSPRLLAAAQSTGKNSIAATTATMNRKTNRVRCVCVVQF